MLRDAYNIRRMMAGIVGVILVGLWLLVPLLHTTHHHHDAHHDAGHDEQSCAMCAMAGHGVALHTGSPKVRSLPVISKLKYSPHPNLAVLYNRPDVRSNGPQGPPSA